MRIKKEIKLRLLNLKIAEQSSFQIKAISKEKNKNSQAKRISKLEIKKLNSTLFFKNNLKFPLSLEPFNINNPANITEDTLYLKESCFHFKKSFKSINQFSTSLLTFQKILVMVETGSAVKRLLK